jgi:HD-GYP domain-containing protein (c-di-GMP phosphodiesterase class II)
MLRLINIDQINSGMTLAKSVYDENGNLLLSSGLKLNDTYVELLRRSGQTYLYVGDSSSSLDIPEVISESLRLKAARTIKEIITNIRAGNKDINIRIIGNLVDEIIHQINRDKNIFIGLADPRPVQDYLYRHSVNVCVISLVMAKSLVLSKDKLKELGLGALLHDIGKALVPSAVLEKNGPLGEKGLEVVKEHTKLGYSLLAKKKTVGLFARHVPYQHHERADGSGYPRGLINDQITDYAKIVSLVDAFDAMTSDRPHAKGRRNSLVIKELFKLRKSFDSKIMKIFLRSVAPFPIGEKVRLSNGEGGYVIKINPREVDRPVVSVASDGVERLINLSVKKRLDIEPA